MIVTVTANPSLDRAMVLDAPLDVGAVQLAASSREDAGGKGINVGRVIGAAGEETLAVLPLALHDPFAALLADTGLPFHAVPVHGHARSNLTITDPAGVTTKLNLPGASLRSGETDALLAIIVSACEGADWLVLAGSLPKGMDAGFYVEVIAAVRARWGETAPRIAVDTSGAPLRAVVASAHPDLIKPNEHELADLAGVAAPTEDLMNAVLPIAAALVPERVGAALITLGGDGAVFVDGSGALSAPAPRIQVASTVGAGDSSLAGFLLADVRGGDPSECLANAIRYGAAAATLPGTQPPTSADFPPGEIAVTRRANPLT
ncbi:1-phosphofructokinase [Microbacterium halimionae]|uniref:1-phosphofructokinase n=1 Tax=Microbacterium halimionae TaxID=1526413 RepID=A0A7W3JQZ2_9MICO|nr:1-phosphofructokinase [Microbacterium halimionae]MBA8817414.1 1-phosphofructokinase [Microbacterium halimionae]NII96048.1 1-phosphofructokinase [Microbacterium halimionae]